MMSRQKEPPVAPLTIVDFFPGDARALLHIDGKQLVQQIGLDVIRGAVGDILCGGNVRDSTEALTRKRLAVLNTAMLVAFLRGKSANQSFLRSLLESSSQRLGISRGGVSKEERWLLGWLLGLTEKAYQNVLRDDSSALEVYKRRYLDVCEQVIELCHQKYGVLGGEITLGAREKARLDWEFMVFFLNAVGAQALTVRGSEKSAYGKLFEKLILGSVLHILGFRQVAPGKVDDAKRVFWFSSPREKRESDATALFEAGKGVRFDIGFIGRGNPEISLDKVSRFEREIEVGRSKWYMATIILVDRIGQKSRIEGLARRIDGTILQMSLAYWPQQLADVLRKRVGLQHELVGMPESKVQKYLRRRMSDVPLDTFLTTADRGGG